VLQIFATTVTLKISESPDLKKQPKSTSFEKATFKGFPRNLIGVLTMRAKDKRIGKTWTSWGHERAEPQPRSTAKFLVKKVVADPNADIDPLYEPRPDGWLDRCSHEYTFVEKFLETRIGQPFDKAFSEFCTLTRKTPQHQGVFLDNFRGRWARFFITKNGQIGKHARPTKAQWKNRPSKFDKWIEDNVRRNGNNLFVRVNGCWYQVFTKEKCQSDRYAIFDNNADRDGLWRLMKKYGENEVVPSYWYGESQYRIFATKVYGSKDLFAYSKKAVRTRDVPL
jgi:hypothetical protein